MQPADRFGSPSSEDLDSFVRDFNAAFEEALGEELASDIAVEVSSPVSTQAGRVDVGGHSWSAAEVCRGCTGSAACRRQLAVVLAQVRAQLQAVRQHVSECCSACA